MVGLGSLTSALGQGDQARASSQVIIWELDETGSQIKDTIYDKSAFGPLAFQYFPESVTDSKSVDYATRSVPGTSLPVYQWVSSGERSISFDAIFTSDTDITDSGNRDVVDATLIERQRSTGVGKRNIDIRAALAWLRSFLMPVYPVGSPGVAIAPRRLRLSIPRSGIGMLGGDSDNRDAINAIMTNCQITNESWFHSGMPRAVTVALTFVQIAQVGGRVVFPSRDPMFAAAVPGGTAGNYASYRIISAGKV